MSRDAARAQALAEQVGAGATSGTFGAAPAGDIVILAVPYSAVLDVVKQYGEELAGKLLVDITNPINSDFTDFVTPQGSFGAQAKARVSAFIESLGLCPMDTGQLPMARTLEHLALLSLGLVAHSVKNTNFSLGVSFLGSARP